MPLNIAFLEPSPTEIGGLETGATFIKRISTEKDQMRPFMVLHSYLGDKDLVYAANLATGVMHEFQKNTPVQECKMELTVYSIPDEN